MTHEGLYDRRRIIAGGTTNIPTTKLYNDEDGVWNTDGLFVIENGSDIKVSGVTQGDVVRYGGYENEIYVYVGKFGSLKASVNIYNNIPK